MKSHLLDSIRIDVNAFPVSITSRPTGHNSFCRGVFHVLFCLLDISLLNKPFSCLLQTVSILEIRIRAIIPRKKLHFKRNFKNTEQL